MATSLKLQSKKEDLSKADLKVLFLAIAPLLVLVILSFFLFKSVLGKVSSQRVSLETSKVTENILSQKYELLTSIQEGTAGLVDSAAVALPHRDASLMIIAQLKGLIPGRDLILTNLKSGPGVKEKNGLTRFEVQFDIDGSFAGVLAYLQDLPSVAPLTRLDKVDLNTTGASTRASIVLSTFSAELPAKLSPITQALGDFTPAERDVLIILSRLTSPPFIEVNPQPPQAPRNPFD